MIRVAFAIERPESPAAFLARVGPSRGILRALVRRRDTSRYVPLTEGDLAPGDDVLVYNIDPAIDDELHAANALFSEVYYVNWLQDVWPDERAIIASELPARDGKILEICCGAGRCAAALVRDGNAVTAIDTSAESIHYASAIDRAGVDYRVADAAALPFADGHFDAGCCFENSLGVLFGKRGGALSELIRVVRPGGRVVLSLREVPDVEPGTLRVHHYDEGYLEFAVTFARARVDALLAEATAQSRARVASHRIVEGGKRPWGGTTFYLLLDVS